MRSERRKSSQFPDRFPSTGVSIIHSSGTDSVSRTYGDILKARRIATRHGVTRLDAPGKAIGMMYGNAQERQSAVNDMLLGMRIGIALICESPNERCPARAHAEFAVAWLLESRKKQIRAARLHAYKSVLLFSYTEHPDVAPNNKHDFVSYRQSRSDVSENYGLERIRIRRVEMPTCKDAVSLFASFNCADPFR